MSDTIRKALDAAEIGLANLVSYQSSGNSPSIHEYGQARRALESVRAALAQPQAAQPEAGTWRDKLQRQCVEWGVYWRAPDAHGVGLTKDQAIELLASVLGVEVEISTPPAPPAPQAEPAAAAPQERHYPACNFWMNPIGSPGCICAVVNKNDLRAEGWEPCGSTYHPPTLQPAVVELIQRLRDWADTRYEWQLGEQLAMRNDMANAADELERAALASAPHAREPLTEPELIRLWREPFKQQNEDSWFVEYARAIERAHGIGLSMTKRPAGRRG